MGIYISSVTFNLTFIVSKVKPKFFYVKKIEIDCPRVFEKIVLIRFMFKENYRKVFFKQQ